MRKNINDRDIEEVELILAPKCEFRASDKLKTRILDEARVLSRGKKFRFVPWVVMPVLLDCCSCLSAICSLAI